MKLLGFRNSSPYLPYPPIPFLLHSRFRIIFLTNGSHCVIIFRKHRDSNLTRARAGKKGHSSMPSRRESAGKYWNFSPFLGLKGTLYFVLHQGVALEKRAPFTPKTHKNPRFCPRYARADPGPRSRIDDDRFAGRSRFRQGKLHDVPRKPGRTPQRD